MVAGMISDAQACPYRAGRINLVPHPEAGGVASSIVSGVVAAAGEHGATAPLSDLCGA